MPFRNQCFREDLPPFLSKFAWRIDKLVAQPRTMAHFDSVVAEWAQFERARRVKAREWEDRRRTHFEESIPADTRLQDRQAGPPGPGCLWDFYESTAAGKIVRLEGWIPPDLNRGCRPSDDLPLPLNRDHCPSDDGLPPPPRELSVHEYYAVLAAVHFVGTKDVRKVDPWRDIVLTNEGDAETSGFGQPHRLRVEGQAGRTSRETQSACTDR